MRVLVTGAAGFIGRHLVAALAARGALRDIAGVLHRIDELILADRLPFVAPGPVADASDRRVTVVTGDFSDPAFLRSILGGGVDGIFHLASTLTMQAESEFERGIAVNVHGAMGLLEACRAQRAPPRMVFASSIAAFGGPLPATVDDAVALTPQTSYGTHKAIVELLVNDYTRHGFVDGRTLRLPIVLIRPSSASPAVSDRLAAIVREPLMGRDVVCPLAAETAIPVASARRVAAALLDMYDLPARSFGHTRSMNMPSLTVTVGAMVQSLERFRDRRPLGRIVWEQDSRLQAVVQGWPSHFVSERAARAGIRANGSFDEIVDAFLEDYLPRDPPDA
jgi:D-erythronate 2-dehydrogenase